PSASFPTRLATRPSSPSKLVMYAKFAGAPPSCLPSGSISQRSSPSPTTVNRFIVPSRLVGNSHLQLNRCNVFLECATGRSVRFHLRGRLQFAFRILGSAQIPVGLAQQ